MNHLLFADNSVIFCKADLETNKSIQLLLNKYENASEQKINREKTSMIFSRNVTEELKEGIMSLWGRSHTQQYESYLGLPSIVGK